MGSFCDDLALLYAQAKLYIWQNYPLHGRIEASAENFDYFKSLAVAQAPRAATAPQPVARPSSAPIVSPPPSPTPLPKQVPAPIPREPEIPNIAPSDKKAPELPAEPPTKPSEADKPKKAPEKGFKPKGFTLNEMQEVQDNSQELQALLKDCMPSVKVLQAPPPLVATTPIFILSFDESRQERLFLEHIAKAIHLSFGYPCQVIQAALWLEQRRSSAKTTKLIMAVASRLSAIEALNALYREDTKQGRAHLADISFLPLPDLTLQMRQPNLKAALWDTIAQAVSRYVR